MSVSVCMATYNGDKYIVRQIKSILEQLGDGDEIIAVDDCSNDKTVEKLKEFYDDRIKIYENKKNQGDVFSFNRSIELAKNEFIFLSDQDDIWLPGRVEVMLKYLLDSNASVITTNFDWIDASDTLINVIYDGVSECDSKKYLKNIINIFLGKTNYFGCAMALRKDFLPRVLPIPSFVESHDLWIAMASNIIRSNVHLNEKTFLKRKHGNNATSTLSTRLIYKKLWSRVIFVISLMVLLIRG